MMGGRCFIPSITMVLIIFKLKKRSLRSRLSQKSDSHTGSSILSILFQLMYQTLGTSWGPTWHIVILWCFTCWTLRSSSFRKLGRPSLPRSRSWLSLKETSEVLNLLRNTWNRIDWKLLRGIQWCKIRISYFILQWFQRIEGRQELRRSRYIETESWLE